jgi:hypothetical protein
MKSRGIAQETETAVVSDRRWGPMALDLTRSGPKKRRQKAVVRPLRQAHPSGGASGDVGAIGPAALVRHRLAK